METYKVTVDDEGATNWYNSKDELHRLDGPAFENASGTKMWYKEGKCHRVDGSAVEWANGFKEWFIEGALHRTDGPAYEWGDGTKQWYLEGKEYSEEEYHNKLHCEGKVVDIYGKKYKLTGV